MRKALHWLVGIGVGAFFLALSVRDGRLDGIFESSLALDWSEGILRSERAGVTSWSTTLQGLAAYAGCLVGIHVLRVWRWAPLLRPLVRLSATTLNRISSVGFMSVFLLPFRLGEAVRPWLLTREAPEVPFSTGLATIVVERVADGLTVTAFLFLSMLLLPGEWSVPNAVIVGAWSALGVFVTASAFILILHRSGDRFIGSITRIFRRFTNSGADRAGALLRGFHAGLAVLPERRALLTFLVLTVSNWSLNGLGLRLLSLGFGLDLPLPMCFIMMACVVVGMMIPNSPGNVGTYWYFLLLPLAATPEIESLPAVTAFGFTAYAMQLLQQSSFGLVFILRRKVRWKTLQEATEADISEPGGASHG